jgi:NADH-quinone oxidoreductase subunit E
VRGGSRILEAVSRKIGIGPGETTDDKEFSLERVACFGSCALAPVVVVDEKVHGRMTTKKTEKLIEGTK